MKVLHVVTLVSPDGAYGGPVRVAVNQAKALRTRGHDVHLAAAVRGYDSVPADLEGVPFHGFPAVQALPGVGFAGTAAPTLLAWLRRHAGEFDVAHVHLARDLVTLPAARMVRRRCRRLVLQTHGMVDPSTRLLSRPLDLGLTRPVLRSADAVLYLTDVERRGLLAVAPDIARLDRVENGVPTYVASPSPAPSSPEVLFLARLQQRKRPLTFVAAVAPLVDEHPDWRFTLAGPDEGEGLEVTRRLAELGSDRARWEGPVPMDRAQERVAAAAVYVLPSVDEPFPMSVLEAMAAGVPVVVTDTCGLAGYVTEAGAGTVVDDSVESLRDAVAQLIDDPDLRRRAAQDARRLVDERFSMPAVAEKLEAAYTGAPRTGPSHA